MTTRSCFKAVPGPHWPPRTGDLIRSENNMCYCNVVLSVSEIQRTQDYLYGKSRFVYVRSVRYASTLDGYCNGTRSRSIRFFENDQKWQLVEEFKAVDNRERISHVIRTLKDVDTVYRDPVAEDTGYEEDDE